MTPKTEMVTPAVVGAGREMPIDAGLLLKRLEDQILGGEKLDQARAVLHKASLWRRMDLSDRLRWADLAQMAQDPATARRVLEEVNRSHPDHLPAWERHLALLSLVGPAEAFAALLVRARPHIGEAACARWRESAGTAAIPEEEELRTAASPFDRYHHRMAAMGRFLALFAGRDDCFARQWADRGAGKQGYVPERRPMGVPDLEAHLSGSKTYGIYLLRADGRIRLATIDADLNKDFRGRPPDPPTRRLIRREALHLIARLKELARAVGLSPLVEFSGSKGYHFWFFFDTPADAGPVRAALQGLVRQVAPDLTAFSLEVFPKQDQPGGKGFGNLVKLPLGVHRATGKRSFFLGCADRCLEAQLDHLAGVRPASPLALVENSQKPAAEVVPHPRWRQWAETYPELACLQGACAPLAQVMSLCLDGGRLSLREEKILYQTIGFLPNANRLLHYLMAKLPEYNPHLVDYRLSRLRGTPLGCRRIHALLGHTGPVCRFAGAFDYPHPLLHIDGWREPAHPPAEKAQDLSAALERLQTAILQVERFLK